MSVLILVQLQELVGRSIAAQLGLRVRTDFVRHLGATKAADVPADISVAAYVRSLDLWGKAGKIDVGWGQYCFDGTAISGPCATAAEGANVTCNWDTTGMALGSYFIYGVTDDGVNPPVGVYSTGQVTIDQPPNIPPFTCTTQPLT